MKTSNARRAAALLAATTLVAVAAMSAQAAFQWSNITQNGNPDISGQLQMTVSQQPAGEVDFTFRNNGPISSVITEVYFDFGSAFTGQLGVAGGKSTVGANWLTGSGVSFGFDSKANFPGGNSLTPKFGTDLAAEATHPSPQNGIQNSTASSGYDWLTVKLMLDNSNPSYAQLIDALNSGSFLVGLHVQGIGPGDGSDSYVTAVPESATILAGLLLLIPFAFSTVQFLRNKNLR